MIQGIEHTAIASPDPQRLANWYVENLGFVINFRPANTKIVFVKAPNGSMIEIIEANNAPRQSVELTNPGIRHMAMLVSDFDAEYARLKAAGVQFLTEPATVGPLTSSMVCAATSGACRQHDGVCRLARTGRGTPPASRRA
jgi:glyoxylase I family protein